MFRALVTGFENFQGVENPTKIVVREYKNKALKDIEVIPEILPVSFRKAPKKISELIDYYEPKMVLSLGLGEFDEKKLRIEKYGRNEAYGIDNDGLEPPDNIIDSNGPNLVKVNLPLDKIHKLVTKEGIPAYISEWAGEYVCNYLIYTTIRSLDSSKKFGFYHIPIPGKKTLELEQLIKSIDITLESHKG